ncbi:MAG: putative toxin-antitoxin system toxin component, PIN family [Rickettsiales bacterium]
MIVVIDTSVYVSALVFGGVPQLAVSKALDLPCMLAVSNELIEELEQTLKRKFGWSNQKITEAKKYLWSNSILCNPAVVKASRDRNDDHVLGCAIAAKAKMLVTGDKDLLVLHPFDDIDIIKPSQFIEEY